MDTLTTAMDLTRMGFHVFPVLPNSKLPAITGFPNRASMMLGPLRDFWTDPVMGTVRDYNVGISCTRFREDKALLVVDVDKNKGGYESLNFLEDCLGLTLPQTLTQVTSTGGRHLIYWVDEAVSQTVGTLAKGIDTRSKGGYIVAHGSTLNGKPYLFEDINTPVVKAPEWLIEKHKRAPKPQPRADLRVIIDQELAERRAVDFLNTLPPAQEGMRNDQAFRAAAKVKDYGLNKTSAQVVMTQAFKSEPPMDVSEIEQVVNSAYAYGQNAVGVDSPEAAFEKVLVDNPGDTGGKPAPKNPLEAMNDEYALVMAGNGCNILWFTKDKDGQPDTRHLRPDAFTLKLANQKMFVEDREKPIAKLWMEWPGRREFDGVVFDPSNRSPKRFYNTWQGFTCAPKATGTESAQRAIDLFLEHIHKNVCHGNAQHAAWVIGWLAHIIQKPAEKPRTALVLRGKKGTGKSVIFTIMRKILGRHFFSVANRRYLTGNFNGHLEGKILYALEEAFWSGDKATDGILKDLVTGEKHVIERKGCESYEVENLCRVAILGNEDWIVPATEDERRYAVFDVANHNRLDDEFFGDMIDHMDPGLLLQFFLNVDLSAVNINKIPDTKALADQKHESMDAMHKWWAESLRTGDLIGRGVEGWPEHISVEHSREAYREYLDQSGHRGRAPNSYRIAAFLKIACPAAQERRIGPRGAQVRSLVLPDIALARSQWEAFIGHKLEWPELPDEAVDDQSPRQ
jgi:hypothetical protein